MLDQNNRGINKKFLVILATPFYLEKGSSMRARSNLLAITQFREIDVITYPIGKDIPLANANIIRAKIPLYKKKSAGPSASKIYADILLLVNVFFHLLKFKKDYSMIIGEDCEGGLIALILGKIFRKKHLYEMYNPFTETIKPYTKNSLILWFFKKIDRFLEKNTNYITTEWEYDLERLRRHFPNKKMAFIPDAFPDTQISVKKLPKKYIVYSGNFKKYQGVDLLIEAFEKYKKNHQDNELKLVCVGKSNIIIKKKVYQKGLDNEVIFREHLPIEKVNYILKKAYSLYCQGASMDPQA
jgi:glycosyltransferase involved in cell wall biosynthesis